VTFRNEEKAEPQACPNCSATARIDHQGRKWKVLCSMNKSIHSECKIEGHTMFSRKEAVRVWNELKKVNGGQPG